MIVAGWRSSANHWIFANIDPTQTFYVLNEGESNELEININREHEHQQQRDVLRSVVKFASFP